MTGSTFSLPPDDEHDARINDELEDDQFNVIIEALIKGDRRRMRELDPEMGTTIDQLLSWAELSGFADEPPTEGAFDTQIARGTTHRPKPTGQNLSPMAPPGLTAPRHATHRGGTSRFHLAAIVSGIAALLLIGLAAYGVRSLVVDRDDDSSAPTVSFAALSTTPTSPNAIPSPTAYPTLASNQSVTYVVPPLSVDDCVAEQRSREELLDILDTPPGANPLSGIGSRTANAETRDQIDALLRSWWSCHAYGMTWEQTAYESRQYIREIIYPYPRMTLPLSSGTLNELLDARAWVDADRLSVLPPNTTEILTISPDGFVWMTSETEPGPRIITAEVALVSAISGDVLGSTYEMKFIYEDGSWKIRADDPRNAEPFLRSSSADLFGVQYRENPRYWTHA